MIDTLLAYKNKFQKPPFWDEIGLKNGLINKPAQINPIKTREFQSLTQRPNYSVLDTQNTKKIINLENIHWKNELFRSFENFYSKKI